jgi:transcriptional regulator with GAF, ATPase, and Fis domain
MAIGAVPERDPRPIVVYDPRDDRAEAVALLLGDLAQVVPHRLPPPAERRTPADAIIYVLGVGDSVAAAVGLTAWIALCQRIAPVVSYGHGPAGWPVAAKAAILLAGCGALVDLAQPEGAARLRACVGRLLERERSDSAERSTASAALELGGLVGVSQPMLAVGRWLTRVGPLSNTPALIVGETGTGKELAARALHRLDPARRGGPFVPVNCASLSPALAESDLFGHRRGAFTGAEATRLGFVKSAQGGVLFLDEVGELEPASQAKLLRMLQDHRVVALGEDRETLVDVRVIAATNRDLEGMIDAGGFRRDLFHRLSITTLRLPPLRERRADIGLLIEHFLRKHLSPAASAAAIEPEARQALEQLEYAGNVRELENHVQGALAAAGSDPIGLVDLPPAVLLQLSAAAEPTPSPHDAETSGSPDLDRLATAICNGERTLDDALAECERTILRRTLDFTHRNQAGAARLLGVSARAVYRKLRRLGLS